MAKKHDIYSFYLFVGSEFKKISEIADTLGEYTEFKEKFSELSTKKERNEKVWNNFLIKYYSRVLSDWAKYLINIINTRTTIGESFAEIETKLSEFIKKLETENLESVILNQYHKEILNLENQIKEKLSIEKYNRQKSRDDLIIGFILGLVGAILLRRFFGI